MSLEEFIANINEEDLKKLNEEYYKKQNKISTYQYSKIRDIELDALIDIEKKIDKSKFIEWFEKSSDLSSEVELFLKNLILENEDLIDDYNEEDLKVYFIVPLLNKVNFKMKEQNIRGFYENKLTYKTDKFIFSGTTDFVVSQGLLKSKKPYFFLQEFKRSEEFSNPRPQLLAELVSAVELNGWSSIKGVYVIGGNWYFVVLDKIGNNKYKYYVSRSYSCINSEDLKIIYNNLMFVKNEILEMVANTRRY